MKFKVTQPGSPHDVGDIVELDEIPQYLVNKVEPVSEAKLEPQKLEVATPSAERADVKGAKKGA